MLSDELEGNDMVRMSNMGLSERRLIVLLKFPVVMRKGSNIVAAEAVRLKGIRSHD
jgi:hypothetical protein